MGNLYDDILDRSIRGSIREEDYLQEKYDLYFPVTYIPSTSGMKAIKIITAGEYKGLQYAVVSDGNYPRCYTECSETFYKNTDHEKIDLHPHGEMTYMGRFNDLRAFFHIPKYVSKFCIGWDYGHYGDWIGRYEDVINRIEKNRKWTTRELVADCKKMIDQYLILKQNMK